MTNTRFDDWVEAFVCQPDFNTISSYWDWLPRELKMCVLLYERHRLARRMIYRMGLAFSHVNSCSLKKYDKLDFGAYRTELLCRLAASRPACVSSYIKMSINEYITSVTLDVPWIVHETKVNRQKHHDDCCGFYAHLSWLRWTQLRHWKVMKANVGSSLCMDIDRFKKRKIHFEAYHLFCSDKALSRANIFLIDHGCLSPSEARVRQWL